MPTVAESISIRRRGEHATIEIDGKEFPWHTAREDILTSTTTEGMGTVTITIPALRISVDDDADPAVPDCPNHHARQHRDGREPWCNECHLTEDGREPVTLGGARFSS